MFVFYNENYGVRRCPTFCTVLPYLEFYDFGDCLLQIMWRIFAYSEMLIFILERKETKHVVDAQEGRLSEMVLLSTQNKY